MTEFYLRFAIAMLILITRSRYLKQWHGYTHYVFERFSRCVAHPPHASGCGVPPVLATDHPENAAEKRCLATRASRSWCGLLVTSPRFDAATLCASVLCASVAMARGSELDSGHTLALLHGSCVAFFTVELVLRAQTFGAGLCTSGWRTIHHRRDGALVPPPLLHTGRGVFDTVLTAAALAQLLLRPLLSNRVDDGILSLARPLLSARLLSAWWLPHVRAGCAATVGRATLVVAAWRPLLASALVLLALTAVFAPLAVAEIGGGAYGCIYGGGYATANASHYVVTPLTSTHAECEASRHHSGYVDGDGDGWRCVWLPIVRVSVAHHPAARQRAACEASTFGLPATATNQQVGSGWRSRWRNDALSFDTFGEAWLSLVLGAQPEVWFRVLVMAMSAADRAAPNTTGTVDPVHARNVARRAGSGTQPHASDRVTVPWGPLREWGDASGGVRAAVVVLLYGATLQWLLSQLW